MEKTPRIHHIDSLRAFAILMMLQGHFIYSLMAHQYRNPDNFWYSIWFYGKGFTAPIFFTITGLVVVYLMLRKQDHAYQSERFKKGIRRGLYLIFWGYLLRVNFFGLLQLQLYASFWAIDVLHCIGIGLILLVSIQRITLLLHWPPLLFALILLSTGTLIFLFEPIYKVWDVSWLPRGIANYFTKANGSVFTPLPWVGYTIIGGFIGALYHLYYSRQWLGVPLLAFGFAIIGWMLANWSSPLLMDLYRISNWEAFKAVAYNNYLFIRLGHILMFISGFIFFEKWFAQLDWFNQIGRKTLDIYILHFIVLYGSWFGLGLSKFWYAVLSPGVVIIGALIFMVVISVLALNLPFFKSIILRFIGANQPKALQSLKAKTLWWTSRIKSFF